MKHSEPNRADTESQKAIDPLRHQRVFNSLLLPPGCTNWEPRGRAACNKVECTSINCDKFLCHTRADVEDEPTAEGAGGGGGTVGVSSCATALVNKVNFKHRLNVMGNIICAHCQRTTSQRSDQA